MINCSQIVDEYYADLLNEDKKRREGKPKTSFWASDCLKPAVEIYWKWTNEPETNPIEANTLNMFKIANACEDIVIKQLVKIGYAVDLSDTELCAKMGLNIVRRDGSPPQIRMDMEREHIFTSGYLDGMMLNGSPIEVKSTRSSKIERDLSLGYPPNANYLHQLACYMDFFGAESGVLITISRPDGSIYFTELLHLGEGIYQTGDQSGCIPRWMEEKDDYEPPIEAISTQGKELTFDLYDEFRRFRKIMEDSIIPLKQPALDYQYRPPVTPELLSHYFTPAKDGVKANDTKIRKAIKGERVLSDHIWQPQYCHWKILWIEQEMKQKGFKTVDDLCRYTKEDIAIMMDYIGVKWVAIKSGKNKGKMRLLKKKEIK